MAAINQRELEQLIFQATAETLDVEMVFTALRNVMTFYMATVCPDCRKNIARKLKREIPMMKANADRFAAEHPDVPKHDQPH
jgi:hypothetical protein